MATNKPESQTAREQKKQEGTQQQGTQQQGGELARREPTQVARGPAALMREFARDPFSVMREMMRWDPFREAAPLTWGERGWAPDFDVRETKDSYVFKADLPGTKKEDIDISLIGNRLKVSGKREDEEETRGDTYYACERSYGSFVRTFTLPDTADTEHVSSNFDDGVLTLVVPKTAESKARKIQIGSGEKH
jgi:HSP20 family protein